MERATVPWRFAALPALALLFWYLLTIPGTIGPRVSDGRSMYLVTQAIVDRHDVSLADPFEPLLARGWQPPGPPGPPWCPTEPAVLGVGQRIGGPVFAKFGLGQSLLAAPLYWLGLRLAPLATPADRPLVAVFATSTYNALVTALTALVLCALSLRLGLTRRRSLAVTLLFGLATPAWAYTTTFFSEPSIALCLIVAVAALLWREIPTAGCAAVIGLALGVALLVRLDSALYAIPFAASLAVRAPRERRPALLLAVGLAPMLALAATGAYNAARFGSPFTAGYGIAGDTHDLHPPHTLKALWEGVYGPLLSPGKGLFLYAPIALLAIPGFVRLARGGDRAAGALIASVVALAVLAHANTAIVWLGGWAWGPRFLIPIVPVLLLAAGTALRDAGPAVRRLAWLLGALGALIQIPAVVLDRGAAIAYLRDHHGAVSYRGAQYGGCIWRAEDLYKWHPVYTPLLGQWERLLDPATYRDQRARLRAVAGGSGRILSAQRSFAEGRQAPAPQAWWRMLRLTGAPLPPLLISAAALLALALAALFGALRALGPPETSPERPSTHWR